MIHLIHSAIFLSLINNQQSTINQSINQSLLHYPTLNFITESLSSSTSSINLSSVEYIKYTYTYESTLHHEGCFSRSCIAARQCERWCSQDASQEGFLE
ncbi:hypothetical protein EYC84_009066 [Monilinia fructicola]|uniref:Uncharacterized protein n=1 Tax=Monilinia fructicola TaxID=38448 RepID=A0A5M9JCP8_MONFR|nr:hypothetical protein EYC84_009066 [Monilinia fructicola]